MTARKNKREIEELFRKLNGRDLDILRALHKYRYLTTHHLRRMYFKDSISGLAALRACNRILAKLCRYGLVAHLKRRIGGVRAGSGAFVWLLAPAGARLLDIAEPRSEASPRKRRFEPSFAFLEHTLAVAETAVRLDEMEEAGKLKVLAAANEPDCWRGYSGAGGEPKTLKPDMFAVTAIGEYTDNWFLEIDLATEALSTVLKKCLQYISYYKTGLEQQKYGVFPYVVWIVPDEKRRDTVTGRIEELPHRKAQLFVVILMDELELLLIKGAEDFKKERIKL